MSIGVGCGGGYSSAFDRFVIIRYSAFSVLRGGGTGVLVPTPPRMQLSREYEGLLSARTISYDTYSLC